MKVRYRLVVTGKDRPKTSISVKDLPITIGRLPTSTICVDEAPISRQHCVVIPTGAGLTVLDQGSTNGTFVNGLRRQHSRLQHGDEIKVGKTTIEVNAAPSQTPERTSPAPVSLARSTPPPPIPGPLRPDQQLELLEKLGRQLALAPSTHEARQTLLDLVLESFPFHRVMLLLNDSSGESSRVRVLVSRSVGEYSLPNDVLNRKLVRRVMSRDRAEFSDGGGQLNTPKTSRLHSTAAFCAPIYIEGRVGGTLYGDTDTPPDWMERREVLELFTTVANLASMLVAPRTPTARPSTPGFDDRESTSKTLRSEEQRIQLAERVTQMEHLERTRTMLLRGLIHDIKNLVGALNSNHGFIQEAIEESTSEMEAMNDAVEISKRIFDLSEDVLSLSRMEEGSFPLTTQAADVQQLLARAQRRHLARARELSVSLALGPIDDGLQVLVDPNVVDRMLDNLIGNALQHAGEDGWLILGADANEDSAELIVADSGPSVPPDERDQVFAEWHGTETTLSRHHGIGLYYCRVAAEAHGGSIRIEGSPGDNRFVIVLPAATLEDAATRTLVTKRPSLDVLTEK